MRRRARAAFCARNLSALLLVSGTMAASAAAQSSAAVGPSVVPHAPPAGPSSTLSISLPPSLSAPLPVALHRQTDIDSASTERQASSLVAGGWRVPGAASAPWWSPVASAVLPGAGQFALRQQRSVAYVVAEAFLIVQYLAARRDGNLERSAYRDLAVNVARKPFGGNAPASWEYYERLEQFLESGAYDRIPGGAVDPETDATTYNGFRWQLARETYWLNPNVAPPVGSAEYQRALDFYQRNAVRDAYRWSWRDAQLEQNLYVETIRSANRSYQRAVNMLGIVAVNHLVSLVDAYVSVRLRRYGGVRVAGYSVDGIQVGYVPTGQGATLRTGIRLAH